MSDEKLEEYLRVVEPKFNSHLEKGTIEMSIEYYTLLEERIRRLIDENESLKKQLEYLRSGEYYSQLRFENKMLQDIVDNGEVSKEDREFIDCTQRNTELLEQQQEFIKYLKSINSFETIGNILSKYKEIIGGNKDE